MGFDHSQPGGYLPMGLASYVDARLRANQAPASVGDGQTSESVDNPVNQPLLEDSLSPCAPCVPL
jgi:hypothetical protein